MTVVRLVDVIQYMAGNAGKISMVVLDVAHMLFKSGE
jgi:hypothetical protein